MEFRSQRVPREHPSSPLFAEVGTQRSREAVGPLGSNPMPGTRALLWTVLRSRLMPFLERITDGLCDFLQKYAEQK